MTSPTSRLRSATQRVTAIAANESRKTKRLLVDEYSRVSKQLRSSPLERVLPGFLGSDLPRNAWPIGLRKHLSSSSSQIDLFQEVQDLPPSQSLVRALKSTVPAEGLVLAVVGPADATQTPGALTVDQFIRLESALTQHTWLVVGTGDSTISDLKSRRLGQHVSVVPDPLDALKRAALFSLAKLFISPLTFDVTRTRVPGWAEIAAASATPIVDPQDIETIASIAGNPAKLKALGRAQRLAALTLAGLESGAGKIDELRVPPRFKDDRLSVRQSPRLVIASHDLKFADGLLAELDRREVHYEVDQWTGHARHDEARSRELLRHADAVFCEWTLGNASWYSKHAPAGVRVTSRFHMQERSVHYIDQLDWKRLSALVFVAEHARQEILRDHVVEAEKTLVVPNMVGVPPQNFSSTPEQRFSLALVGIVPVNKAIHTAFDTLEELRAVDDRYRLHIRGRLPSSYEWMNRRTAERTYYEQQFARIESSPLLRDGVNFVPYGDGLFEWYENQGVVLSTSEFEAFHYSLPEGAVRGAVPLSIAWPGADLIYPAAWLASDASDLCAKIIAATRDEDIWNARRSEAREFVASRFEESRVSKRLADVILGSF